MFLKLLMQKTKCWLSKQSINAPGPQETHRKQNSSNKNWVFLRNFVSDLQTYCVFRPTYKSTTMISNFSNCFVTSYLMHLWITSWIALMLCILTFDSRCMVIVRLVPHLKALPPGFLGGSQMNLRQARAFSGQSHAQG